MPKVQNYDRVYVVNKQKIDSSEPVGVYFPNGTSAFGESITVPQTPFVQAAPVYDYLPANFRAFTQSGGSADVTAHEFAVSTGTTIYGYGAVQSFRSLNYRAGQGAMARMTGRFATGGVANSWQGVGMFSIGDELSFGYNGTSFGIWHRHNGKAEIQRLTITTPSGGSTNATLTLDGTEYTIPLTAGTAAFNCNQIAVWVQANVTTCNAWQQADTVTFTYLSDGNKTGTFSFSHGSAVGAFATVADGVTKTSDFVAQANWNIDTCGWLDPTKGNVYQVSFQYLGYGAITFSVEDPESGRINPVHQIKWANANVSPSLGNPSLRVGIYAASIGSTTNISVYSASIAAFVQGLVTQNRNPRSVSNVKTAVTTTPTNIITIRNRSEVNGNTNQVEAEMLQLSVFTESNKGATIQIIAGTTLGGSPNYTNTGTNLIIAKDVAGTTVSGGSVLATYVVPGGSSLVISLSALGIRIPPGLTLSVVGNVNSGASAEIGAAIVYHEDV